MTSTSSPAASRSSPVESAHALSVPERLAFFILLAVVGVRPLVGENYESALDPILPVGAAPSGPGPVFPLTMGSLVLLAAALAVVGRARRGGPIVRRPGGFWAGGVLLAIGMAISLLVASNRRLAINASSDWLLMVVLCGLLVWLLRRPWQIRLLLCVMAATATAFAFQCVLQRAVEFRETIAEYEAHKATYWEAQNTALDDPKVQLYERRLYAREASGYFPHSNVAGSFLLLAAWTTAALAIAKLRGHGGAFQLGFGVLALVWAVGLFGCILLTGSRGAAAAGVLTGVAAIGWVWLMRHLRWGWQGRLVLGWLVVLAVAGAVVLYVRQAPPRSSMGFRWGYWRNTAHLIGDYFATGIGAQNFGRYYLAYKPVTDPEEIRDPHNFFLTAFAQWGAIGAAGLVVLGLGASMRLARPSSSADAHGADTHEPAEQPGTRGKGLGSAAPRSGPAGTSLEEPPAYATAWALLPWFVGLAVVIFLLRLWMILGYPSTFLFYATAVPLIVWCLAFALLTLESNRFAFWSDAPIPPAVSFVLLGGALAFLLHGMVDMAVFYPGTATAFFAVVAAAIAARQQDAPVRAAAPGTSSYGRVRVVLVALPVVLWAVHFVWLWRPAASVQFHLAAARRHVPLENGVDPATSAALREYDRAIRADAMDPTPPMEAAEWLLGAAIGARSEEPPPPEKAKTLLDESARLIHVAESRDPHEIGIFRTKTSVNFVRAERFASLVYARAAVGAAENVVNLYPASPQDHTLLAEVIVRRAGLEPAENRAILLQEAIGQYERALAMDAARPGEVELRRWSADVRQELADRVDELKAAISQPATSPATQPATLPTTAAAGDDLPSSRRSTPADN